MLMFLNFKYLCLKIYFLHIYVKILCKISRKEKIFRGILGKKFV